MIDLADRLRALVGALPWRDQQHTIEDAIAEIERLRAKVSALEARLPAPSAAGDNDEARFKATIGDQD